ncbi:hypothetical protein Cgig2_033657 [Carnegiea gigantea]|uniref:Uncharacterized protein n=1 Tax=Carnegiea gigantea TaxID=171969 RepID=A0A9Q1JYQ7_9CARY|nr:hypothetical protein Cgig2_033657 [Carnegiea gigantea]
MAGRPQKPSQSCEVSIEAKAEKLSRPHIKTNNSGSIYRQKTWVIYSSPQFLELLAKLLTCLCRLEHNRSRTDSCRCLCRKGILVPAALPPVTGYTISHKPRLEWGTNNPLQATLIHSHPDQDFDETTQFVFQMEGPNEIPRYQGEARSRGVKGSGPEDSCVKKWPYVHPENSNKEQYPINYGELSKAFEVRRLKVARKEGNETLMGNYQSSQ